MSDSELNTPEQDESAVETPTVETADEAVEETAREAVEEAADAEGKDEKEKEKIPYELVVREIRPGSVLYLEFKVDYEEYTKKVDTIFADVRKNAIIEGFRKGKAPLNLLRARFRKGVQEDAVDQIRRNVLGQFFDAESPDVVSEVVFEDGDDPKPDQPMTIKASMEVQPKIESIDYSGLEVEILQRSVTDQNIDEALERMRNEGASYVAEDNLPVSEETGVLCNMRAIDDRDRQLEHVTKDNYQITNITTSLPTPVAQALIGKKAGETVMADAPNKRKNQAGAVLSENDHYTIEIVEVQRKELPELNDEFARDQGDFETLAALKDNLRKEFDRQNEMLRKRDIFQGALEKLVEKNPLDVPRSMAINSANHIFQEEYYRILMAGMASPLTDDARLELIERYMPAGEVMAKNSLLIDAIGTLESLEVTDDDLDKEIERVAEEQGRKPLAIRAQLERQKQLDDVRANLKTAKVRDFLISKATVRELSEDDYKAMIQKKNAAEVSATADASADAPVE